MFSQEQSSTIDNTLQKAENRSLYNGKKGKDIITDNDIKMLKEFLKSYVGKGYVANMENVKSFDTTRLKIDTTILEHLWKNDDCQDCFTWKGNISYFFLCKRHTVMYKNNKL